MTTNSTKYFCKRGAVSARLNLVDASLSVEYRYDGEHGKYYFGARYFDTFFGMWMSPDPAAVFFREVYAPLKWRDFIEKDILQRLNGEAVLLKHSFRASAQFANPYTYGGDPLNYVDPNGEAVHILVGAIIGAVVGTVNGVIQCTSAGGGSCGKAIGVGFVGGAAIGGGTAAYNCADQGGSCTKAVSTGVTVGALAGAAGGGAGALVGAAGGPIAGGLIGGGAGSGTGYLANGVMTGQDMNLGDFAKTTMDGAAAGLVGSAAGAWGSGALASMSGGFAGSSYGALSNGVRGWDVLHAGAIGAGSAFIGYSVGWSISNYEGDWISEGGDSRANKMVVDTGPKGTELGDQWLDEANDQLRIFQDGRDIEIGGRFKVKTRFWSGKEYLSSQLYEGGPRSVKVPAKLYDDFRMHLHTKNTFITPASEIVGQNYASNGDYSTSTYYSKYGIKSYFVNPSNTIFRIGTINDPHYYTIHY